MTEHGLVLSILNGLQTAEKAAIVARAEQRGSITIATNPAGRGTDIKLTEDVQTVGRSPRRGG